MPTLLAAEARSQPPAGRASWCELCLNTASQVGTEPPKFELALQTTQEKRVDHKYASLQNDGPDLVPLKAVVALLWLVAGLVAVVALDRPDIDNLNNVVAAPESLAAAAAP
jgi:hypothetical protein